MGFLPGTLNFGLRMRRECRERFTHHRGLAIPTCITARAWRTCRYMPGSLIRRFLWNRWRGKRSRHPRHMRNPQFYVSGKRPILCSALMWFISGSFSSSDSTDTRIIRWSLDSNVHGSKVGPIWGRQDPGEPLAVPMNLALWVVS